MLNVARVDFLQADNVGVDSGQNVFRTVFVIVGAGLIEGELALAVKNRSPPCWFQC